MLTLSDMIAVLGETTAGFQLPKLRDQMLSTQEGRQILIDRPRITESSINLAALQAMPAGSFGKAYADWLAW